ncbi:MAG: hypothetical protein HQ541_01085, partial [Mariniphaga sp.]|nr:hypothetical protein [Mariniphaga sp.]
GNIVNEESIEYTGPYNQEIEKPHLFVFVVPLEGINSETFISAIGQFNDTVSSELNLTIEEQALDDFRNMVKINGLPDKETAMQYFRQLVQERSLFVPLGNAEYRNFLITEENFGIFLEEKNITEYMDFYKRIYLGQ